VAVTVAVPTATPVKVTVQLRDVNMQLASTVPTELLDETRLTLPVAVFSGAVVSATFTEHEEVEPTLMLLGVQATLVEVSSFVGTVTVIVFEVPELGLWLASPP